jgi:spore germination protein YaaH
MGKCMSAKYDDFRDYGDSYGYDGQDEGYGDADYGYFDEFAESDYAEEAPWTEREYDRYDGRRGTGRTSAGRAGKSGKGSRKNASGRKAGGKRPAGKRPIKRRKRRGTPIFAVVVLLLILVAAFGAKLFLDRYSYSTEQADLAEAFGVQGEDDVPIVWGNELSEIHAKRINGIDYMKLSDVKSQLNDRFYYGKQNASDETGMIIYCFPTYKLTVAVGSQTVTIGDETQTLEYTPAVNVDGEIYLALDFVKLYTNFGMTAYENPNRLQIDTSWDAQTVATIKRRTQIRTSGGIKSDVKEQLEKGDQVTVLEQMETWSKVKSADSVIGYVENKRLTDIRKQTPEQVTDYTEPEYTHMTVDGKINMAFHNVWGSQGNGTLTSYMSQTKSVNVVAPTWYWVSDNDGNMEKAASEDYITQAHAMGCQVWAVVDNINSSSLQQLDNHTFLTTLDARTNLINQLIQEQAAYGFEGINVDFEQIPTENGDDYIEFIRELSIACRNAGIILSVDNYPYYEFNYHYDLEEQSLFVDYLVVMGYDEHYAGSQEAGSVASISYVTEGIQRALNAGVDKDRLINAIPFYSRVWKTENGSVSSTALGMADIQTYMAEHGMTASWDASVGQNYAETTENGVLIQIWVEDAQSIQQKLDVMQSFGIKGVAEWKLQFETADVWDNIANYVNQQ